MLKRLLEDTLSHLVALVLFAGATAVITALGGIGLAYVFVPSLATAMAALILFGCMFILALFTLLWLRGRRPQFDPLETDYKTLRKEISMKYLSRDKAIYTRKYQLQALKNDLDTFYDFYCWTGSDVTKITAKNPRHRIFQPGTRGPYNQLSVALGSALRKGDTCEVEITWELVDDKKQAKPFISTVVNEPTDSLFMQVQMFPEGSNTDVVCEFCPTSSSRKNIQSFNKKFQGDVITWEIPSPRLFHHYEIRWDGPQWQ